VEQKQRKMDRQYRVGTALVATGLYFAYKKWWCKKEGLQSPQEEEVPIEVKATQVENPPQPTQVENQNLNNHENNIPNNAEVPPPLDYKEDAFSRAVANGEGFDYILCTAAEIKNITRNPVHKSLYKDANKAVYQRKNEPSKKEGAGVRYMAPNRILYIQGYLPPPEQLRAANPQ
jgi:hypothetical protein